MSKTRATSKRRVRARPIENDDICANCGADMMLLEGSVKVGKDSVCINATACEKRKGAK